MGRATRRRRATVVERRWRRLLPVFLAAGLVACGSAPITISQPLRGATETTVSRSAAPAASGAPASAAPARTAPPASAPPASAPPASAAPASSAPASSAPASSAPASGAPASATPTRAAASAAPSGSAAPAPTVAASTAPASAAPAQPTAAPVPGGTVPAGWQVWRGPAEFPIVFAYPPDWRVDTSRMADQVIFIAPIGAEDDEIIEIINGPQQFDANIDVLRDEFFTNRIDFCTERGIEFTERRQLTGAAFALLHASCNSGGRLLFLQIATGLKGGDEWDITMRTTYERKEQRLRQVFDPILSTINVYALIMR